MTADSRPCQVFVSHATTDKPWVRRLLRRLRAIDAGELRWFYDEESLEMGDDFVEVIERALQEARVVLLIATPDSVVRPWIQREIARANRVIVLTRADVAVPGLPKSVLRFRADGWVDRNALAWQVIERCRRECGLPPPTVGQRSQYWIERAAAPVMLALCALVMAAQMSGWVPRAAELEPTTVVSMGWETDRALRERGLLDGPDRCHDHPIPLTCMAAAIGVLEEAGPTRVALDLDLGGDEAVDELRGDAEFAALRDALGGTDELQVLLPMDANTERLDLPPCSAGRCFDWHQSVQAGGHRVIGVPLGEAWPLGMLLAGSPYRPVGAVRMLLPWTASRDLRVAVIERPLDDLGPGDLAGRRVVLGARFPEATRPDGASRRPSEDLAMVPRGPLASSEEVSGAQIHALVASYASGAHYRWAPSAALSWLFVALGVIGGVAWRRWVPAALLGLWLAWSVLGFPAGWVLPILPPLVLAVLDLLYRRWVW